MPPPQTSSPSFPIDSPGKISGAFRDRNIRSFEEAADFVRALPYERNADRKNPLALFNDGCGTCSTKHALLKRLCDENNFSGIKLIIGIYRMNAANTPAVAKVLNQNKLIYLPEAHCYLRSGDAILDYTKSSIKPSHYVPDLLEEISIEAEQAGDFKVVYHRNFIAKWLEENPQIGFSAEEIWKIREDCIAALAE